MAVTEEANVDESITAETKASNKMENYLKYEQNTKAYEETMNIYIKNINRIEKRNKVYKNNGEKSTKLYNQILKGKLTSFRMIL